VLFIVFVGGDSKCLFPCYLQFKVKCYSFIHFLCFDVWRDSFFFRFDGLVEVKKGDNPRLITQLAGGDCPRYPHVGYEMVLGIFQGFAEVCSFEYGIKVGEWGNPF